MSVAFAAAFAVVLGVAAVLPAAGTYFLVPRGRVADRGSVRVSDRTVRATRGGVSASAGSAGVWMVGPIGLFLG